MKHLKLFENKDSQTIVEEAIGEYNKVSDLIRDYIKFENPDMDIQSVYYYYYEHDLEKVGDTGLIASYTDSKYNSLDEYVYLIDEKSLSKLYKFMEDPELYKSVKMYNL